MSMRDDAAHLVREATEVMATSCKAPYAALIVSSVVLGFELFK